jgi:hypothetical protein
MLRPSLPFALATALAAQAATEAAIDDDLLLQRIETGCDKLREQGLLHKVDELAKDCDGRRCELPAVEPSATPLPPPQLRERLLHSACIVGHFYSCAECKKWHFSASSGFAVCKDGLVATCFHLLEDDPEMPNACLVIADWDGSVWPVTAVVAADKGADVAILQCARKDLVPLPLRTDARTGDHVYCLSNPDHQFACFTDGMIARRYVVRGAAPGTAGDDGKNSSAASDHGRPIDPKARVLQFLQVTCEFAVGSSGAPVADDRGNVIGMAQSTATVFVDPDQQPAEPQMVSRAAVPAAALRALAK